jgi:hypothetical protein
MDKLNKLKVEKFRILKDSELKEIIGRGLYSECACGSGSCSWRGGAMNGMGSINTGLCSYSSIARTCICS